jgi:hypothetical protein
MHRLTAWGVSSLPPAALRDELCGAEAVPPAEVGPERRGGGAEGGWATIDYREAIDYREGGGTRRDEMYGWKQGGWMDVARLYSSLDSSLVQSTHLYRYSGGAGRVGSRRDGALMLARLPVYSSATARLDFGRALLAAYTGYRKVVWAQCVGEEGWMDGWMDGWPVDRDGWKGVYAAFFPRSACRIHSAGSCRLRSAAAATRW